MRKLNIIIGMAMTLAIAIWTLAPTQAFAQHGTKATIKASAHVAGIVIGKPVRSEKGVALGTVENIVLSDNGCAKYVILSGQFSGAGSKLYPIPWSFIARSGPDAILVDIEPDILVNAPSFEVNNWPDFSQPQWETRVHSFFKTKAEVTVPGKRGEADRTSGAVRSEEKARTETRAKQKHREWEKRATQGAGSPEEKIKGEVRSEKERKHKVDEMTREKPRTMGAPESSRQKGQDVRGKQRIEREEGRVAPGRSQMMERGQSQMMERGRSHTERGGSALMERERPEKKSGPDRGGAAVEPGQTRMEMR